RHAVGHAATCGEDEDGNRILPLAQPAEEGEAVAARQSEVEHQEIIGIDAERIEGPLGAIHTIDRETLCAETVVKRGHERSVVLHDEEPHDFGRIPERLDRFQHLRRAVRVHHFTLCSWKGHYALSKVVMPSLRVPSSPAWPHPLRPVPPAPR